MKTLVKKSLARITKNQAGFTLIELLVVVGIIVALAAIIVPAVAKFVQKGDEGAAAGEFDTVQVAMDAVMADAMTTSVVPHDNGTGAGGDVGISDWAAFPTLDPDGDPLYTLDQYMRDFDTDYQYCWDKRGNVVQLWKDGTPSGVVGQDHADASEPWEATETAQTCISP